MHIEFPNNFANCIYNIQCTYSEGSIESMACYKNIILHNKKVYK